MMRRLVLLAFLFVAGALSVSAQATGAFNGFCDNGGRFSITSGLTSSNYLEGIIPNCTVTVYLTGTTTLATIFKDAGGTPLGNPFTAATTGPTVAAPGQWLFFAATGVGYDVVMSGGTPPNTFALPVTLTDLQNGGSGGGGGPLLQTNSVNNLSQSLLNLVNSTTVTFTNTSGGNVQATANVASNCPGGTSGQIQFNNGSGACGGFTAGQDATIDTSTGNVTLATVNSGPGLCGDSTHVCQITTDGKGRVLSQSQIAISGSGGSGALERWITTYWNGTNANNGYVYLVTTVLTATTIPSGCTSSQGVALTGATANSLFTISKLAGGPGGTKTTLCSLQFASGGSGGAQTATLITTTGGSLAAGDVVEIDGPATADASLADFTVSLYGTVSGGLVSSVSAANATLNISPTAGAVLASVNTANAFTWTATHTFSATLGFDASGATQAKLPVGASATTAANGELKYDTTNKNWHAWVNGADTLLIPLASGFVSGDCGAPTSTAGTWVIADSGAGCGGGGGGGNANNLNGGALGSAPYQSNTNVTAFIAGPTTTGQTFFYGWQPSGSLIAPQAINLGTYLASPPAIGGTTPAAGTFSTINGRALVSNTTVTVGTTTVSANSCNGPFTATMTNMTVTSVPIWSAATNISGVSGWGSTGGLNIVSWPTANTLNYVVCNATAVNITPSSSAVFNVGAQ